MCDNIDWCLRFRVTDKCNVTKARRSVLELAHGRVDTPVFMPVGTQGTIKGLTTTQIKQLGIQILLGNTYHLGTRPGSDIVRDAGGLHKFMNWDDGGCILTDSGGFQMVSLSKLSVVSEDGVKFEHPVDGSEILLTPEKSMQIQLDLGSDIVMQLDDTVSSLTVGPRVEQAMLRSVRWLDRCITQFPPNTKQNLFAIIQGGLNPSLRKHCIEEMIKRNTPGLAIGGLSGGESKDEFWRIVSLCTDYLPETKPRYLMGVGYAEDLVVCSALGCDMFDCVFPTRTSRFGSALTFTGTLKLKNGEFNGDSEPLDADCTCYTCKNYSRHELHKLFSVDSVACTLLTIHNLAFQQSLMSKIRQSVTEQVFPTFVRNFMSDYYCQNDRDVPGWIVEALQSVNIELNKN